MKVLKYQREYNYEREHPLVSGLLGALLSYLGLTNSILYWLSTIEFLHM